VTKRGKQKGNNIKKDVKTNEEKTEKDNKKEQVQVCKGIQNRNEETVAEGGVLVPTKHEDVRGNPSRREDGGCFLYILQFG